MAERLIKLILIISLLINSAGQGYLSRAQSRDALRPMAAAHSVKMSGAGILLDNSLPGKFGSPTRLYRNSPERDIRPFLMPTELPVFASIVEEAMEKGTKKLLSERIDCWEADKEIWDLWLPDGAAENIRKSNTKSSSAGSSEHEQAEKASGQKRGTSAPLKALSSQKARRLTGILREILVDVEFDKLNKKVHVILYKDEALPLDEMVIGWVKKQLRDDDKVADVEVRRREALLFFMYGETLDRWQVERIFGQERKKYIDDFIRLGICVAAEDGRIRVNSLSLVSRKLKNGETIYVFADTPERFGTALYPERVYVGPDSCTLLQRIEKIKNISGVTVDMGSGSGIQLISLLKLFPGISKGIGMEIDERARNICRLNAWMNGVGERLRVVKDEQALREELGDERISFVVMNPPFMPIPEIVSISPKEKKLLEGVAPLLKKKDDFYLNLKEIYPIAGWGGTDGIAATRQFLDMVLPLLKNGAEILIYSCFAGDEHRPTKIFEYLRPKKGLRARFKPISTFKFTALNWAMNMSTLIYQVNPVLLQKRFKTFRVSLRKKIEEAFTQSGITHIHDGYIIIQFKSSSATKAKSSSAGRIAVDERRLYSDENIFEAEKEEVLQKMEASGLKYYFLIVNKQIKDEKKKPICKHEIYEIKREGSDISVRAVVWRDAFAVLRGLPEPEGNPAFLEQVSDLKSIPIIRPDRPIILSEGRLEKGWGEEILYSMIEARYIADVTDSAGLKKSKLSDALKLFPKSFGIDPEENLTLLKILSPKKAPKIGDLYLEVHWQKYELYVVTDIDREVWPDGKGRVACGLDPNLMQDYKHRYPEDWQEQYRKDFRAASDAYRNEIYEKYTARGKKAPDKKESEYRDAVYRFIGYREVEVGDVLIFPKGTVHSLRHGIEVAEILSFHYERGIIVPTLKPVTSFKGEWSTDEAFSAMDMSVYATPEFNVSAQMPNKYKVEDLATFPISNKFFTTQRVSLKKEAAIQENTVSKKREKSYHILMPIKGSLEISSQDGWKTRLNTKKALIIPENTGGYNIRPSEDEDAVYLKIFITSVHPAKAEAVKSALSEKAPNPKTASAGRSPTLLLNKAKGLKEAVATLIYEADRDPKRLRKISFELATLLLSKDGHSFEWQISADLIRCIHHLRNYYKDILRVYGEALAIASSVNPELKRFFKPASHEAGQPYNDYQRNKNRLAGFYRDEEFAVDFLKAFESEPKLNQPWYVNSQIAILDCINGIEFKTQAVLDGVVEDLTRQLEVPEQMNVLVKNRLEELIRSLKDRGIEKGETYNDILIREFNQSHKRRAKKTDLFKTMQAIKKRKGIEISLGDGVEYIDIAGEVKELSDAYWVLLRQALGDSRINYRAEDLCYPETPQPEKRPGIILFSQDKNGQLLLIDPQRVKKVMGEQGLFRLYVILENDPKIYPARRLSYSNIWQYVLGDRPAEMPDIPDLVAVSVDIIPAKNEIMSYLDYLKDLLIQESIGDEQWPLLHEKIRRNLEKLLKRLRSGKSHRRMKDALRMAGLMYEVLSFYAHKGPLQSWFRSIFGAGEPETKVFFLPLEPDTHPVGIKAKRILKWSFPKEKDRDKPSLKAEIFLKALRERVKRGIGFGGDYDFLYIPCFEMILNGMAYGKGIEIEVYSGTDKEGLRIIIAIGRDKGRGIANLNQLLQDSYKAKAGVKAVLSGDLEAEKGGFGLSNIIEFPNHVIIETKGQKRPKVMGGRDKFIFGYGGSSDVKRGTRITLIWREGKRESLIMEMDRDRALSTIDTAA